MKTKRLICSRCERPERTCICSFCCTLSPQTEVLILQHPLEQKNAKGTAKLLELSLSHCRIERGEQFDTEQLQSWLTDNTEGDKQNLLLYPASPDQNINTLCASEIDQQMAVRLIVLDGTWRKSRKLLHSNPLLQQLPRLALTRAHPSGYHIRKAHKPDQLSTLEACACALNELEGLNTHPLTEGFHRFIKQQQTLAQQGSDRIVK